MMVGHRCEHHTSLWMRPSEVAQGGFARIATLLNVAEHTRRAGVHL
jgi:hypothetical protein